MKILVFTIYDEKAEVYGQPFFTPAIGIASRLFSDLANNPESPIGKHPADYKLYHIGYYTDENARFDNNENPVYIGAGQDYVTPTNTGIREVKQNAR